MAVVKYKLGKHGKLYWGAAGSTADQLVPAVKDVTVKADSEFLDIRTRDAGGFKVEQAGDNIVEVSFDVLERTDTSTFIEALETAWLDGDSVALMPLHKAEGRGPDGDFAITFERGEPIGDAVSHKVTAKLQNWREWHKG